MPLELPKMVKSAHDHTHYVGGTTTIGDTFLNELHPGAVQRVQEIPAKHEVWTSTLINQPEDTKVPKNAPQTEPPVRLVRVIIIDPDTRLPLDARILYKGKEELTDATDEELLYSIKLPELLAVHNRFRTKAVDEERSRSADNPVYLEPARIRDLTMSVVTIAEF